jgi:hypothetical protein
MAVTTLMIATALDVADPDPQSTQAAQWNMWIADALMLIEARKAELSIETELDAAKLDYVVRQAVVAHIQRPDDATQVTISVDDGSSSRTYRSGKGRIVILDEWWALLGLIGLSSGAYSVDMVGTASTHVAWCALAFGALYCSCGSDIAGYPIYEQE